MVTELHVLSKGKTLCHGDVAISLEQHHGIRLAGLHVSDQKLGENIETKLYIGNCLNKPNGQEPTVV